MFYQPVYADRHFSKEIEYSAIQWAKLSSIVPAFRARIFDWYFEPAKLLAKDWHMSFSVAAIDCLLIDTMAQFEKGAAKSKGEFFIDFLADKLPQFAVPLPAIIKCPNGKPPITTPAEAMYYGFRCCILHEAHIAPYCQILPEAQIVRAEATGKTKYADRTDCCAVVIDPPKLLEALERLFEKYIADLLDVNRKNDGLRRNFKKKFTSNYGIDIAVAT